ncbi:sensor histidine kinase [Flavobacterium sp. 3HN19-14]|uniref:sensor histidine kinase n=1 Tax=Flavobacterium sp. 3HN19-14 TaxID=3448133 RepID=UPI003EE3A7F1
MTVCLVLTLLFLLLALQNRREKYLWLLTVYTSLICAVVLMDILHFGHDRTFAVQKWYNLGGNFLSPVPFLMTPIIVIRLLNRKLTKDLKTFLFLNVILFSQSILPFEQGIIWLCVGVIWSLTNLFLQRKNLKNFGWKQILLAIFKSLRIFLLITVILLAVKLVADQFTTVVVLTELAVISGYYVVTSWRAIRGAQWAIITGLFLSFFTVSVLLITSAMYQSTIFPNSTILNTIFLLSMPLSLLVFVALRFKEVLSEVQTNADRVVQLSTEKQQILSGQKEQLEQQVKERTSALNQSIDDLKSTQTQLIQSEKMASLGELTAGIAHEIQNPLNFVNNFSDVSSEMVDEMNEELDKGDIEKAKAIASDIKQNLEKITHHGKRADAIVKGMLQHSRSSSGTKELTDINALADEYLRLSYHGLRAKDKSFNAKLETDFDASIGKINVLPQDLGRVILNLLTNAFYAVNEKKQSNPENYDPTVSISTKKIGNQVEIRVSDNGNGIPQSAISKIFQPFFTTKPTGEGTGLGLSLAYDIITKGHNGELAVTTEENKGTAFTILLPI